MSDTNTAKVDMMSSKTSVGSIIFRKKNYSKNNICRRKTFHIYRWRDKFQASSHK